MKEGYQTLRGTKAAKCDWVVIGNSYNPLSITRQSRN